MSETGSKTVAGIDTDRLLESLDYEALFEGTALEGVESEDSSIIEAIGRRLGEAIGRTIGEIVGSKLGAILLPAIVGANTGGGDSGDSGNSEEEKEEESESASSDDEDTEEDE